MTPPRSLRISAPLATEIAALNADCAAALDERRYADWLALFARECAYWLQPRENHDRGLPLCTLALESRGMLMDRIYGIENTLFHQPYYQRHVLGVSRVLALEGPDGDCLHTETAYAVFRTRHAEPSEVFNVGRYLDRLVREDGELRIAERRAIFDSELIPNSVIYPI